MFGSGRYFGLRGQSLNLAVGIIAGIDFLSDPFLSHLKVGSIEFPIALATSWRHLIFFPHGGVSVIVLRVCRA